MPGRGKRAGLSSADKEALLSSVYASGGRKQRGGDAAPKSVKVDPAKTDFATLAGYQELKTQNVAGELLGLENPFYRSHQTRAGATTIIDGRECINFASYDYLGLNGHDEVIAAAKAAIDEFGTSVSASRITAGERPVHAELEDALAAYHGVEAAAAFVSGHGANVNAIGDLMGPKDLILYDAYIHNSVTVGAKLSGAARRNFPHGDLETLERILAEKRNSYDRVLIITEGLFSMDGDYPDLPALIDLKQRYGAWLMVDEAHSIGVLGEKGRGIAEHFGIDPTQIDIWMGTLSKTLAACGGYIAGCSALVDYLKFISAGFVYSVGLSPPLAAAARAALAIIEAEPERTARLKSNGRLFTDLAKSAGLDTGHGQGYSIVPVLVGDSLRTVKLSQQLRARGLNVIPIIYPAVPMKSGRLRFFVTSEHSEQQIRNAVNWTREELDRLLEENFSIETAALSLSGENS